MPDFPMAEADKEETYSAIDAEAKDPAERKDSRLLYDALRERRDQIKTETSLPEDRALSEKILAEARTRSAQISASRGGTSHRIPAASAGIPWWIWVGWVIAIAGVVVAVKYLL
jgi:hypothetical protein